MTPQRLATLTTREYFIILFNFICRKMEKQGMFESATSVVVADCKTKGDTATAKTRNTKTGQTGTARVVKENGVWKIDEIK